MTDHTYTQLPNLPTGSANLPRLVKARGNIHEFRDQREPIATPARKDPDVSKGVLETSLRCPLEMGQRCVGGTT